MHNLYMVCVSMHVFCIALNSSFYNNLQAVPEYLFSGTTFCRNFPQGCVSDMVTDVSTGIGYVCQNIENYGGDPSM